MARKSIAPWSERVSEGLIDQPVDSTITASQTLRATVDTGFIDQTGTWKGIVSSDTLFSSIQLDSGVANGAAIITPTKNADGTWPLDMTGFSDLMIAVKPSNSGTYQLVAIMGPSDLSFGGLTPLNAASDLRIADDPTSNAFTDILNDTNETMVADVWNIYSLPSRTKGQKVLQFKITNSSGGSSDIETAFMRLV